MGAVLPFDSRGILKPGGPQTQLPANFAVPFGLVGYWPFDADCVTPTLALDLSGSKNGTLSGATKPSLAAGQVGEALSFDGSTSFITFGIHGIGPLLNGVPGTTVAAWIKYSALTGTEFGNVIFTTLQVGGVAGVWMNIRNDVGNVGKIEAGGRSKSTDTFQAATTATALSAGVMAHVVAVQNFATGRIQIYLNGAQSVSGAATYGSTTYVDSVSGASADCIGASAGASLYGGVLDDVRLYNRALDPWEVIQLYQAGLAGRRDAGAGLGADADFSALPTGDLVHCLPFFATMGQLKSF